VALVGYTNAGKSTLMNALTGAGVSVNDQLFETLDTRTREMKLPDGREIMLSDTVGFIRKLPHHLVASFHATLEEAREADLLVHVCDASSPTAMAQVDSVREVLGNIGCGDTPTILALNKMDVLEDDSAIPLLRRKADEVVCISARTGEGIEDIMELITEFLDEEQLELMVETGVGNGKLFSFLYENGAVIDRNYSNGKAELHVKVPERLKGIIESMGGRTLDVKKAGQPLRVEAGTRPVVEHS
jgi:GTP-binding protein HflX